MTVHVVTKQLAGEAEVWDPAVPEPFAALAGSQFLGQEGETALVRDNDGCVHHAHPGCAAVRIDGQPGVGFLSVSAYRAYWEHAAPGVLRRSRACVPPVC